MILNELWDSFEARRVPVIGLPASAKFKEAGEEPAEWRAKTQ
jgi:hypothetical protein